MENQEYKERLAKMRQKTRAKKKNVTADTKYKLRQVIEAQWKVNDLLDQIEQEYGLEAVNVEGTSFATVMGANEEIAETVDKAVEALENFIAWRDVTAKTDGDDEKDV